MRHTMRHKISALLGVMILVAAALTVGIQTWGSPKNRADTAQSAASESTAVPEPVAASESTAAPAPAAAPEPISDPWTGPLVPDQGTGISREYFSDAAFIGNSVMSGLEMYDYDLLLHDENGQTIPDFYWANSQTVLNVSDQVSRMEGHQYGKIYICLGTNEMSNDKDVLRQAFTDLIRQLQENDPGCILYLMSVPPVSAYRSSTDRCYTREYVLEMNDMLLDIAREEQIWYLDIYSVLCDSEGYLPSNVTNDGVHFSGDHYSCWFDYLQSHYIPDDAPDRTDAPAEDASAA